ncbi:MAG: hypothetical protein K2X99_12180 [Gemmatimonadaceae bacterium]|nr:hypothetical protein [Gemmatimonadaceae bacterium]
MTTLTARPRRGFVLPLVIIFIFVLTAALAAGFTITRGERALDDQGRTAVQSQTLAETGMQRALTDRAAIGLSATPPAAAESVRVNVTGGYYDVIVTRIRPTGVATNLPALYLVRSKGVQTSSQVAGAASAQYSVTTFTTWQAGTLTAQSALTGIAGTDKAGAAGTISGIDACGAKATIAAIATPTTDFEGDAGYQGSTSPLEGSPLVQSLGSSPAAAAATVPVDWNAIVNGGAITPTFTVSYNGTGFPPDSWFTANPGSYPVIYVQNGPWRSAPNNGEFDLTTDQRGVLIVEGDIELSGSGAGWDGIVLVGGRLRSNGSNEIRGATIAGLNVKLGYAAGTVDVNDLNGTKKFLYNSCSIASAANSFGGMRAYRNTWANGFRTW